MPKAPLIAEQSLLEQQIIETLIAGLKVWRSDLSYPESYSDMQACVRGLLIAFKVERNPLPVPLKYKCDDCEGLGHLTTSIENGCKHQLTCKVCKGRGYILGT